MDILSLELRKLGLKEKEVAVYLAGLELGASPIQEIAREAGVTRPTTYEIIETLESKGLFTQTKEGKKRLFLAQSPEKILSMLRLQKRELEEKEREFIRIIATLESRYTAKDKSTVQVFEGKEALELLKEQILFTATRDIVVFSSKKGRANSWLGEIEKRLGKVSVKERVAPKLEGTLFLGGKAIFVSDKKQEGYLIDNPLAVSSLKNLL